VISFAVIKDFVGRCLRNVEKNTTIAASLELLQGLILALPPTEVDCDEFKENTRDAVLANAEERDGIISLIVQNTRCILFFTFIV